METKIAEEIIESCPKAFSSLVSYFLKLNDTTTELKGEAPEVTFTRLTRTLLKNGDNRFLLDFFDSYNIFITPDIISTDNWLFKLKDVAGSVICEGANCLNRSAAEQKAFYFAFKELEARL